MVVAIEVTWLAGCRSTPEMKQDRARSARSKLAREEIAAIEHHVGGREIW